MDDANTLHSSRGTSRPRPAAGNEGKLVELTYRGFFDDGSVFLAQERPVEIPCLAAWMPPPLFDCVRSMEVGTTRTVRVGAETAYEARTDDRVLAIPRNKISPTRRLAVGEIAHLENGAGKTVPARVIEIADEQVVFDANHAAVCKALNFEITLLAAKELPSRP